MAFLLDILTSRRSPLYDTFYKDRVDETIADSRKVVDGELTPAELGLRASGNAVAATGEMLTAPAMALLDAGTPQVVQDAFQELIAKGMDTETAREVLRMVEENPRAAKNIGAALNISALLPGGALVKNVAKKAAFNAPNELPFFYAGNPAAMIGDVVPAGVGTVWHTVNDYINPFALANNRAGVPSRLKAVAQEKVTIADAYQKQLAGQPLSFKEKALIKKRQLRNQETSVERLAADAPSFLEGQLEYTYLLHEAYRKAGQEIPEALQNTFSKLGVYKVTDNLTGKDLLEASAKYKPEMFEGVPNADKMLEGMSNRFKAAWGVDDNTRYVVKHPTAFTDLHNESRRGSVSSKTALSLYRAKEQRAANGFKDFESEQDMLDFANLRSLVKKKTASSGWDYSRLDQYYKYRKMLRDGEKLNKTQQAIWKEIRDTLDNGDAKLEDGVVYLQDSHKSASKAMGGVNDQFAFDRQGNVLAIVSDENDLFGMSAPGGKRVISMATPYRYNLFKEVKTGSDVGKAAKTEMMESLKSPARGTTKDALKLQAGEELANFQAPVKPQDLLPAPAAAAGAGFLTGLQEELNNE